MQVQVGDIVAMRTHFFAGGVRTGEVVAVREEYSDAGRAKFGDARVGVAVERDATGGCVHWVGRRAVHPAPEEDQLVQAFKDHGFRWPDIPAFGERNAF